MAIFKKAKEVFIPDSMVDTNTWLSDEDLIKVFRLLEENNV